MYTVTDIIFWVIYQPLQMGRHDKEYLCGCAWITGFRPDRNAAISRNREYGPPDRNAAISRNREYSPYRGGGDTLSFSF